MSALQYILNICCIENIQKDGQRGMTYTTTWGWYICECTISIKGTNWSTQPILNYNTNYLLMFGGYYKLKDCMSIQVVIWVAYHLNTIQHWVTLCRYESYQSMEVLARCFIDLNDIQNTRSLKCICNLFALEIYMVLSIYLIGIKILLRVWGMDPVFFSPNVEGALSC